jgi:hypothetical protein
MWKSLNERHNAIEYIYNTTPEGITNLFEAVFQMEIWDIARRVCPENLRALNIPKRVSSKGNGDSCKAI